MLLIVLRNNTLVIGATIRLKSPTSATESVETEKIAID